MICVSLSGSRLDYLISHFSTRFYAELLIAIYFLSLIKRQFEHLFLTMLERVVLLRLRKWIIVNSSFSAHRIHNLLYTPMELYIYLICASYDCKIRR